MGDARRAHEAGGRRRVHDHAGALGVHVAQLGAHAQPHALEVHREHRVPVVLGHLVQPAEAAGDAGVVDPDVDAALALGDRVEGGADLVGRRHVQSAGLDAVELLRQPRERLGVAVEHGDARALLDERVRGCPPDAGGTARHRHYLALQAQIHRSPSRSRRPRIPHRNGIGSPYRIALADALGEGRVDNGADA